MKRIASAKIDGSTMYYSSKKIEEYIKNKFGNKNVKINLINSGMYSGRMELLINGSVNKEDALEEFRRYSSHAIGILQP